MVDRGLGLLENYRRMLEVFVRDWFLDLSELKEGQPIPEQTLQPSI